MPDVGVCAVCKSNIKEEDCIYCDICKLQHHGTCAGLTRQEVVCLRNANRKINFFCTGCNLIDTVNSLRSEISTLKMELNAVKKATQEKNDIPVVFSGNDNQQPFTNDQLFDEIDERQRRASNLIIHNLAESTAEDTSGKTPMTLAR